MVIIAAHFLILYRISSLPNRLWSLHRFFSLGRCFLKACFCRFEKFRQFLPGSPLSRNTVECLLYRIDRHGDQYHPGNGRRSPAERIHTWENSHSIHMVCPRYHFSCSDFSDISDVYRSFLGDSKPGTHLYGIGTDRLGVQYVLDGFLDCCLFLLERYRRHYDSLARRSSKYRSFAL